MATALDVAACVVETDETLTAMQLQKLVYYSYAWWLVDHADPLFSGEIKAWVDGPVVDEVYAKHKSRPERGVVRGRQTPLGRGDRPHSWRRGPLRSSER